MNRRQIVELVVVVVSIAFAIWINVIAFKKRER